ncbi:hypothetical protein SSP24_50310 [Streptomyces spinoverrucosus]|uniref:Uncharacterized protein n=1 Tax=Streptomyces spinoverrucosus TaxID=284043 RepID=A0A4Y3VQY2_9ACTN|nr:hypothetical protein SSP24_50310 [Streptomyces spinoverrucosus]GHB55019.1 hypothetical protein GCM10010397_26740 [Streptomyces spinoverrucosus]
MYIKIFVLDVRQRMPDIVGIRNGAGADGKTDRPHSVVTDDEDMCRFVQTASLRWWVESSDYRSACKEPVGEERVQDVNDREV